MPAKLIYVSSGPYKRYEYGLREIELRHRANRNLLDELIRIRISRIPDADMLKKKYVKIVKGKASTKSETYDNR